MCVCFFFLAKTSYFIAVIVPLTMKRLTGSDWLSQSVDQFVQILMYSFMMNKYFTWYNQAIQL